MMFGAGQNPFPGYVRVVATDETLALHLMKVHYGCESCHVALSLDDIPPDHRLEYDVIIFNQAGEEAMSRFCYICGKNCHDDELAMELRPTGEGYPVCNVRYCRDNPRCKAGIDDFIQEIRDGRNDSCSWLD